jgi:hypothetical protein
MRARADTRRRALHVQALYSVRALARAASVSPKLLLRLLRAAKVELLRSGRAVYVPLEQIEAKVPGLWKSILAAERLRNAAR